MTTEHTEATEPPLDTTTPAPSEDATESIYAWSHSDDETQAIHQRSWKLPIAVAALAIAAVATVIAVNVWPHHAAPVRPATSASAPPLDRDTGYLNTLSQNADVGGLVANPGAALTLGRYACVSLQMGKTVPQTADDLQRLGMSLHAQALGVAEAASTSLCPR